MVIYDVSISKLLTRHHKIFVHVPSLISFRSTRKDTICVFLFIYFYFYSNVHHIQSARETRSRGLQSKNQVAYFMRKCEEDNGYPQI